MCVIRPRYATTIAFVACNSDDDNNNNNNNDNNN